jgi:DNA-binding XRE family transcriptional regulator
LSLERKDVRVKLDPETHEAYSRICERDGVNPGELAESLIEQFVADEMHKYMLSRTKFEGLGILGKIGDGQGSGRKGRRSRRTSGHQRCHRQIYPFTHAISFRKGMLRLKLYLSQKGMTQADLAKQIGVTQPTVWEWLNGHSKPSADRLISLSKLTGLAIDDLLSDPIATVA